jgi:signal transduction histidine kinase/ActR/RegA family two-component response regulator
MAIGHPFTYESRVVRPDGTIRCVVASGQAELSADGAIVAIFGVIQDVTETREAERERQRLLERVTLATQAGHIGIWEWNLLTNEIVGDGNLFELYGLPARTEPQAFDFWKRAFHPEDEQRIADAIAVALHEDGPFDTEYRVIWPNGETHYIRAFGIVLRDAAGQPVQMLGTNWDNTEVRHLAGQVKQEKLELNKAIEKWTAAKEAAEEASRTADEANQAKSEFLARMSHEIRTPMNGIIGFAVLMLDSELNLEQRRHMRYLHDAGNSLLVIINDILDFSKLEAGKLELEQVALDPRAIVDGAVAMIRSEALAKGIALVVDIADDVPQWVVGSPTRLRQILLNLLTNALKFTHRGHVTVTLSGDASGEDRIRFDINDTGIGIALEEQHRLFQYFSQIDGSHQYGGTGLGLAISQRLVEMMHGAIGVTSALGAGSTFWFTARLRATGLSSSRDVDHVTTAIRRRVSVVDDNAVNQIIVQAMLQKDGHEVILVSDGAQAVRAVEAGGFDLVLMDMQMPVMNGEEATRAIRLLGKSVRDIPIVALTANVMNEDVRRCQDAGMNHHLAKPVDRELLRDALAAWAGHC